MLYRMKYIISYLIWSLNFILINSFGPIVNYYLMRDYNIIVCDAGFKLLWIFKKVEEL